MSKLYYTEPEDKLFNEVKEKCIEVWLDLGAEPSYTREKINRIQNLQNIQDNFMYMVAMFDWNNQRKLAYILSLEARKAIRARMIDGGAEDRYIAF